MSLSFSSKPLGTISVSVFMKNVLTFLHGSGRVYFWVHLLHLLLQLGLA